MIRLTYFSRAASNVDNTELADILRVARRRNAADDISGMLVFHNNAFLQILEGPADPVMACFERVKRDRRHSDIHAIQQAPAKTRAFSNWSMGLAEPGTLSLLPQNSLKSLDEIGARLRDVASLEIPEGKRRVADLLQGFLRGVERV